MGHCNALANGSSKLSADEEMVILLIMENRSSLQDSILFNLKKESLAEFFLFTAAGSREFIYCGISSLDLRHRVKDIFIWLASPTWRQQRNILLFLFLISVVLELDRSVCRGSRVELGDSLK